MFGFFKKAAYRANCTAIIQDFVLQEIAIEKQQCVEFVEDYKVFFDKCNENGMEPGGAVMFVTQQLIQHIADDSHHQLRSFNNCKYTEVICLIVAKLALSVMDSKEEKQKLNKAIKAVEKKIKS